MSYCTSCGNPLTPGEKFCPNCGTAVSAAGSSGESQTSVGAGGGGSSSGAASMLPGSAGGGGGGKPNVALIVVLAVVAVLALGTIAVFLMRGSAGSQPAAQTSSLASAPTSTAPSPVVTVTATATPTPTVTVTSTPTPTPTVTVTHTEPAPAPVTNYQDCGSGVVAVGPTSCPFALSVADRFNASGGAYYLPNVYSPATGGTYDMYCDRSYYPVVCTGGNNAEVRIR